MPERALSGSRTQPPTVDVARLEAVVQGPDRLRADLGVSIAVVVLRAGPVAGPVLFLDASPLAQRQDTLNTFEPGATDEVATVLRTWREESRLATGHPMTIGTVPRQELAPTSDLRPSTWLGDHPSPEVVEACRRGLELARELHDLVEGPLQPATTEEHRRALRRLVDGLEALSGRWGRPVQAE